MLLVLKFRLYLIVLKYAFLTGWHSGKFEATQDVKHARLAEAYDALKREARNAFTSI